jgi:hypothetical protein
MADSTKDMAKEMDSVQTMVGTYIPDISNVWPLSILGAQSNSRSNSQVTAHLMMMYILQRSISTE